MASHYKWYPSTEEVVVPWNAQYEFPSQANKAIKVTPRIPPKNGAVFNPGNIIRLEFPAQGYVNTANTTLEFDVTLTGPILPDAATDLQFAVYFQNNIQSIFNRIRLLYGSTPLEDLINQNYIVRQLTEFTSHEGSVLGPCSINEGIGGAVVDYTTSSLGVKSYSLINARQRRIQGITADATAGPLANHYVGVPNALGPADSQVSTTRRYQVQLLCGLMQQGKLLPVKYMASQLAIELTLESPNNCIILQSRGGVVPSGKPTFQVSNVNLIPEILEFDSSYDQQFLQGLVSGGVPLQFSSWHHFQTPVNGATMQMIIQERSRSVKAIFGFMRLQNPVWGDDYGASFGDQVTAASTKAAKLISYQYRIGGRYFPASPVIVAQGSCNDAFGNTIPDTGSTEAFVELQKALNCLGDYRLKQNVNALNWNSPVVSVFGGGDQFKPTTSGSADYGYEAGAISSDGSPLLVSPAPTVRLSTAQPSNCFCFATSLETSNGKEISGLNAEEQSDISLIINWSTSGIIPMQMEVFTYYDALMVLRENNVVELIQ